MKPPLKMNLTVKKITLLVFVIHIIQVYFLLPTADALFINEEKVPVKVPVTMCVEEANVIHKSLGAHLNGTQVQMNKIEDASKMVEVLKQKLENEEELGIIITKMDYVPELIENDLIKPIDKAYEELIFNRLNEKFLKSSLYYQEKLFGLPISRTTPLMYYNIDAIRSSSCELENCTVADIPKNWIDFVILLERCQDKGDKEKPLLLGGEAYDWIFQSMVLQEGGSLLDANNAPNLANSKSIEILERWKALKDKGLINIEKYWDSAINIFRNGESPIVCFSSNGIAKITELEKSNFNWAVGPLPIQQTNNVMLGGINVYLGKNITDEQLEAGIKVMDLLYSENVQLDIFKNGFWPVINGMLDENMDASSNKKAFQIAAKELDKLADVNYSSKQTTLINVLRKAIESVLKNKTSPKQALQTAQDAIENK